MKPFFITARRPFTFQDTNLIKMPLSYRYTKLCILHPRTLSTSDSKPHDLSAHTSTAQPIPYFSRKTNTHILGALGARTLCQPRVSYAVVAHITASNELNERYDRLPLCSLTQFP